MVSKIKSTDTWTLLTSKVLYKLSKKKKVFIMFYLKEKDVNHPFSKMTQWDVN